MSGFNMPIVLMLGQKAFSPEARAAALEARRAKSKGKPEPDKKGQAVPQEGGKGSSGSVSKEALDEFRKMGDFPLETEAKTAEAKAYAKHMTSGLEKNGFSLQATLYNGSKDAVLVIKDKKTGNIWVATSDDEGGDHTYGLVTKEGEESYGMTFGGKGGPEETASLGETLRDATDADGDFLFPEKKVTAKGLYEATDWA